MNVILLVFFNREFLLLNYIVYLLLDCCVFVDEFVICVVYSACNSPVDKDGLRHLLLTRVIMGKSEVVPIGSEQCQPSSEEFDSGVDNLQTPNKYIVWSTHMNTHTLPEYIVSFRAPPSLAGEQFDLIFCCGYLF